MFSRRKRTPRSQSQRPQTTPGKPQAPGRPPEFYARQATRTVRSRTFWLMLVMGILVFVILFFQLYHLQITRHKELQTKALDQQTRQTGGLRLPGHHLRPQRQPAGGIRVHGGRCDVPLPHEKAAG